MAWGISNTLILVAAAGLPLTQAIVPTIDGFTTTWSDDFIGTANSIPNTANWLFDAGTSYPGGAANWGTGEIQTYASSTDVLALTGNGSVGITARRDASGAWTSARIETQRSNFQCAPGGKMRIQASLSLPALGQNGVGYWPAFWALGASLRGNYTNWPIVGELDIMENVNAVPEVYGTMHCGVNPGGPCDETDGLSGNTLPAGSALQGNFHTYAVEVDRSTHTETVTWFLDGTQYWHVTSAQVETTAWNDAIHHGFFVILNVAVGGSFPDKAYGATTPIESTAASGTMYVDYVAVYNSLSG